MLNEAVAEATIRSRCIQSKQEWLEQYHVTLVYSIRPDCMLLLVRYVFDQGLSNVPAAKD